MKVLGIDVSTRSIGYGIIENGKLIEKGKLSFGGGDQHDRMRNAIFELALFAQRKQYDVLCIEEIPFVNSKQVFGSLSTFYGLAVGLLYKEGISVVLPKPLQWQQLIGNPLLTKQEKNDIIRNNPKHSRTWYAEQGRRLRKQRTIAWVNANYHTEITDDDIGDAIAIAHFGSRHGKPIQK